MVLEKYKRYVLKKQFVKTSKYIEKIIPIDDREVPKEMFEQYEVQNDVPKKTMDE